MHSSVIPMEKASEGESDGTVRYSAVYRATKSGRFLYGIRVMPFHPDLFCNQELGLVHWA